MTEDARGARYSDLFESAHDGTSDCAYCPVCTTIAAVRSTKPEVLEHLAVAAREVMLAVGLFLEQASEHVGEQPKDENPVDGDDGKVHRIEIV